MQLLAGCQRSSRVPTGFPGGMAGGGIENVPDSMPSAGLRLVGSTAVVLPYLVNTTDVVPAPDKDMGEV